MEPGLEAQHVYDPPNFSWPVGSHIAVVEVDTETGAVDLVRYIAVDDVGNVINPMVVDGQVHGGIAQGVAQALFEEAVYDEDGNLVTGSAHDYLVPSRGRAAVVRARPHGDAEPDQPARRQGGRRDGHHRLDARRDQRRRRRAVPVRRHRHRDAGHARASLARNSAEVQHDPGRLRLRGRVVGRDAIRLLGQPATTPRSSPAVTRCCRS